MNFNELVLTELLYQGSYAIERSELFERGTRLIYASDSRMSRAKNMLKSLGYQVSDTEKIQIDISDTDYFPTYKYYPAFDTDYSYEKFFETN